MQDTLVIDSPEQLKALGHPLRLRALEMLGEDPGWTLTNRELAQKLGVDPGHLHFHVKMLLRAGLIERAEGGKGREKPYRATAKTIRVAPELLAGGGASDMQAAMIDEVQREYAAYSGDGRFRAAQVTLKLPLEKALEFILECLQSARDQEDDASDPAVLTFFAAPPSVRSD
ncbi:MAG TPA: winged helix-turn-helix domain-containing protein [Gaiellaceae bacterium]